MTSSAAGYDPSDGADGEPAPGDSERARSTGIRALFRPAPGLVYLDAASYGLPPAPTFDAVERAVAMWRSGTGDWMRDWDMPVEASRGLFASLIGVAADEIALVPTVSVGTATIAASLRAGDRVVVRDDEHDSNLYPLLVAEGRGAIVHQVPVERLADAIAPGTSLVVFSLVAGTTGEIVDLRSVAARARDVGARVLVDATHALPFVPVADQIGGIDYLVCAAFKHLLCPRGVGFLYVRRDRWDEVTPILASWRAKSDPFGPYLGGPLELAPDAGRFTMPVTWLPWAGAVPSLALVNTWQRGGEIERARSLADRLALSLGLVPTGSSLVCVPASDAERARANLEGAGVRAAIRAGSIRFAPHVWNTEADVDLAADLVRPYLLEPR